MLGTLQSALVLGQARNAQLGEFFSNPIEAKVVCDEWFVDDGEVFVRPYQFDPSPFLSGSGSRRTGRFATSCSQTPSGLVAETDPRFHIVWDCPNSLSTIQDTSIAIGPLYIFDVIFANEARYVRFCLVTVVCGRKACRQHVR